MGAAPDFQVEIGKQHRLVMGDAEHVQVRHVRQSAVMIDRVRDRGIMVARQQHHRQRRRRDDVGGAVEQLLRQPVTIEGIARQDHHIGAGAARGAQHAGEPGGAVAAVQARGVVMVHMQIGAVSHDEIAGRR